MLGIVFGPQFKSQGTIDFTGLEDVLVLILEFCLVGSPAAFGLRFRLDEERRLRWHELVERRVVVVRLGVLRAVWGHGPRKGTGSGGMSQVT